MSLSDLLDKRERQVKKGTRFFVVLVVFLILSMGLVSCGPDTPPTNNTNIDDEDEWYTEGFTKGTLEQADETDMVTDLINSFANQVRNASTVKVNKLYPQYSLDMGLKIVLDDVPGRVLFQVNGDIENYENRSLHLALYKGEGNNEELFLQVNVLPLNEEQADLFIALKGPEGFTKITMKIFSSGLDRIFPMTLGSAFDSSVSGIAAVIGSYLSFDSEMKYEYKKTATNYYTRHYNIVVDLKTTLARLIKNTEGVPGITEIKSDLDFFFSNILGIDTSTEDSINSTMPPIEIEFDFFTEKGILSSFAGSDSILSKLTLNVIVSEDIDTKNTNPRFKGERMEAEINWDKIVVRRNVLNDNMPDREDLLIYDPLDPNPEAYIMYNHDGPLAIRLEGKYEGDFVEEEEDVHIGFKYNFYQPDGSDDEFCFRVFDEGEEDIIAIYYKDNFAHFIGFSEEPFSFPFSSSSFLMSEGGASEIGEEDLFFKIVTYLVGSVHLLDLDETTITIETEHLSSVLGINVESFSDALNQAYTDAGGTGYLSDILEENGIDLEAFLNGRTFEIKISMDEEFIGIFDSIPDLEGLEE